MVVNKHLVRGIKGKTVCYAIPGFRYDETQGIVQWGAFRFYTPEGGWEDNEGYRYFDVPAGMVRIERDKDRNRNLMIAATQDRGVEILEIFEDMEYEPVVNGLEGDVIANIQIPADKKAWIVIDYKEVTNG